MLTFDKKIDFINFDDLDKYYITMSTLDENTKKFYLQMGYTGAQIQKAYEQSKRTGMDILDALNVPVEPEQSSPLPVPVPIKTFETGNEAKSFSYKSELSFLTPWKRIKPNDYEVMFSKTNKHQLSSGKTELREENYPVGLLNVSNCCYLNSLLQCYFLMNDFKTAILTTEPLPNLEEVLVNESKTKVKRIKSQYELIAKLKQFFTTMALTSKKYLDPTEVLQNLVGSVGEKISYGQEKDLSEINILIIERLSEGLTYSKNHYYSHQSENLLNMDIEKQGSTILQHDRQTQKKGQFNSMFNPRQGTIKKLFYGTRAQYYDDPSLQHEEPIVSDFTGLILHPQSGNLSQALDEEFNFQVEINGGMYKKSTFIRDEPEYLFIYINRTNYDKEEGQMMKNQHKFTFEFTVYLDRYLQKYRKEHTESHEKIKELLASKNKLKEQINHLQILFKKIEQCQRYVQELEGWGDKLPKEEEFQREYDRLEQKLEEVQKDLDQIESRKEQYHLMYIFVHRGDAVSGHYWGYGRNDEQWYRFDINTQTILQDQIIIDLEKSSATPYALLYVKESNLAKFDYKIHMDGSILKQNFHRADFRAFLDPTMANKVISENVKLHEKSLLRSNHNIRDKAFNEYIARLNAVKKIAGKYQDDRDMYKVLRQVEMCNNFSLFLWSKNQIQLSKFTIFEQALYNASNNKVTALKLMHELNLLHLIQKKFKKSLRGEMYLKFYSLLPKEIEKVQMLYQEYQLSAFEVIWGSVVLGESEMYQNQWAAQLSKNKKGDVFEPSQNLKTRIVRILKLLRIRNGLFKCEDFKKALHTLTEPLYISQVNNEITKMLMLSLMTTGFRLESLQQFTDLSDKIGAQLITLNTGNTFSVGKTGDDKGEPVSKAMDFIDKFNEMIEKSSNKRQSARPSASKINEEKKPASGSGFKNSILTSSPQKSNPGARKTSITQEKGDKTQYGLVTSISTILILQPKEAWKLEEFDHMKVNFELGAKLINFLKKMGPLPKVYKTILSREKPLSVAELRQEGVVVNQKSPQNGKSQPQEKPQEKQQQQSLI